MDDLFSPTHDISARSTSLGLMDYSYHTENTDVSLDISELLDLGDPLAKQVTQDDVLASLIFDDTIDTENAEDGNDNYQFGQSLFNELPSYYPEQDSDPTVPVLNELPIDDFDSAVYHYRNEDLDPFKQDTWHLKYSNLDPETISNSIQETIRLENQLETEFCKLKSNRFAQSKLRHRRRDRVIERKKRTSSDLLVWEPESIYKAFTNIKTPHLNSTYFDNISRKSCFGKVNMRCKRAWKRRRRLYNSHYK